MTTQSLTTVQPDSTQPTAADLAKAQAVITVPTVIVCVLVTFVLTVVLNVIGLAIGLIITGLVLFQNAQVRRFSIENAIADRLEKDGQQ